jgi:hypothetical protein
MIAIASATPCACGAPVLLMQIDAGPGKAWQAHCDECLDPESEPGQKIVGYGESPEAALWDRQVSHELAVGSTWVLATTLGDLERQVAQEAEAQRGWAVRVAVFGGIAGHYFCPPDAPWTQEPAA